MEEEAERLQEPEVVDDAKQTVPSSCDRIDAQSSQRLWQDVQDLHKLKSDNPSTRSGSWHKAEQSHTHN